MKGERIGALLPLALLLISCGGQPLLPAPTPMPPEPATPVISSFTATPNDIRFGGSATLSWSVSGATALSITPSVGDMTGRSSVTVSPTISTSYRLSAANANGDTTATTTVTVSGAPPSDPPTDPEPPAPPEDPAPPTDPAPPSGGVRITESVAYDQGDYGYIIGTIENDSGRNIQFTKIVASLYDDGNFVGSDFTYSDLDIIQPGETSPFKMYLLSAPNYDTYELQLESRTTNERPYRPEVRSLRLTNDFYPTLNGQVENTTSETLEFVKIVFTCYRNGELVDTDFTYSDLDTLSPGQTSPFTTYLISPYRDPSECQAIAQGRP